MKIKLDENLGASIARLFIDAGFEATTISDEALNGTPDEQLIEIIRSEEKCLVSLDMGFLQSIEVSPRALSWDYYHASGNSRVLGADN